MAILDVLVEGGERGLEPILMKQKSRTPHKYILHISILFNNQDFMISKHTPLRSHDSNISDPSKYLRKTVQTDQT